MYGVARNLKVKGDKFFNFSELLMFLKNQIINQNSYALLNRCCEDKFLFIDDLGSETTTQWVVEQFFYIINQRYNNCLPIYITTNLGVKELETRYGVRLVSRLVEMCDFIKLNGKDYRRKKEGL
jgi:DNA replication protein DnaC